MKYDQLKENLFELIQFKRKEMMEIASKDGLTSQSTVKCSQDLDHLLNRYERLLKGEKKTKDEGYDFFLEKWTSYAV